MGEQNNEKKNIFYCAVISKKLSKYTLNVVNYWNILEQMNVIPTDI